MGTRKKKFIIGGALVVVAGLALAAVAVWYIVVLPHDAPEQATLAGAVASLDSTSTPTGMAASTTTGTSQADALRGTWVLAESGESFVGYRVQEVLTTVGAFTAVGRTTKVEATLVFDGRAITDVTVEADLTGLQSDNSFRDSALRRQALQSDQFPTATFRLTQPIELNRLPAEGETVSATAVGDLTLHGVTRSVSVPLEGQLTNGYVVVVGTLDIRFADFNIAAPSAPVVASVEDHGTLELQLIFRQASQG